MKIYITFGQVHAHIINGKVFDRDCVAAINCTSREEGLKLARVYFGDKFFTGYDEEFILAPEKLRFFPRGIIEVNPECLL